MSGPIGYEDLRAGTVRQVTQLMAAAAITAPKSGGQLFLAGKPNFMETVIADDPATRRQLAAWMRARGKERRERIWFRDADTAEAADAILFVGLLPGWYPPNDDCGACGYATCAEFLHYTSTLRSQSGDLEFTGPVCNLRDVDLGIAVGSAAKTAALHSIDCRCQTRVATAALKLGLIQNAANSAVGRWVIALARLRGVKTLNIVRREAAAQVVRDAGADRVIVASDDLPAQIADALDGAELALVLDGTAGPIAAGLAGALRFRGVMVTYAFVTDIPPAIPARDLIFNEVTLTGFWLLNWLRHAPRAEIEQTYRTLSDLVAAGAVAVPVDATYRLDDYRAAFERAMTQGHTGKILFTFA